MFDSIIVVQEGEFKGIKYTIDNIGVVDNNSDVFYEIKYTLLSELNDLEKSKFDKWLTDYMSKVLYDNLKKYIQEKEEV